MMSKGEELEVWLKVEIRVCLRVSPFDPFHQNSSFSDRFEKF